jgi:hypothetical protein
VALRLLHFRAVVSRERAAQVVVFRRVTPSRRVVQEQYHGISPSLLARRAVVSMPLVPLPQALLPTPLHPEVAVAVAVDQIPLRLSARVEPLPTMAVAEAVGVEGRTPLQTVAAEGTAEQGSW